ncbi:MAG: hypothetical protein ACYDCC_09210 [Actinomycetota bacterium]
MKRFVAALLAIASACSVPDKTSSLATPTPSSTPAPSEQTTELSALLPSAAPLGYILVPDQSKEQTIDDIAQQADDPEAERTKLESNGFQDGFIKTWVSDDDSQNIIEEIVYQFSSAAGAQAELQSDQNDAKAESDATFNVPGVDGAFGVDRKPPPGSEASQDTFFAVSFVRSDRYYLVSIGGPTPHSAEEVGALARKMDAVAR